MKLTDRKEFRIQLKRLIRKAWAPLFVTLSAAFANADVCIPGPQNVGMPFTKSVGQFTCAEVSFLKRQFETANKLITDSGLKIPSQLEIHLMDQMQAAGGIGYDDVKIIFPLRLLLPTKSIDVMKTKEESIAAALHEYGHAVFAENLELTDSTYAVYRQLRVAFKRASTPDQQKEAVAPLMDFDRKHTISTIVVPYHELFADVFAILVPKAMEMDAVANAISVNGEEQDIPLPWFSRPSDASTWSSTSPHVVFNPVRYFLFKSLTQAGCKASKGKILASIFRALSAEIAVVGDKLPKIDGSNIELTNRRLITALEHSLPQDCRAE